jgi:hypothetical protein
MKYSRPVIAGAVLIFVALILVIVGKIGSDDSREDAADHRAGTSRSGVTAPPSQDTKFSRGERSRGPSESPDAKTLKLLWARGRGQELLVALDQLSQRADADDWRSVADVLVEQAANDGRHEIADYLLATGHGAPAGIRLNIYAAALENPDEGVRASAKLELLNLTGQEFESRAEADAWIASNPAASRDEVEEMPDEE